METKKKPKAADSPLPHRKKVYGESIFMDV